MGKNGEWMYGEIVKNRWRFNERTVATIIYENKIPAYDINYERLDAEEAFHTLIEEQKFRTEDIDNFEIENEDLFKNNAALSEKIMDGKSWRELGQLRRQKEKWDSAIDAAVKIGLFCQEQDRILNFSEIQDRVYGIDKSLPVATIRKIWKSIPKKYKSKGGRPGKE